MFDRRIFFISLFFSLLAFSVFAQTDAQQIMSKVPSFDTSQEAVIYLKKTVPSVADPIEKRSLYTFLASIQEQLSLFSDACVSYATAAGIAVPSDSPSEVVKYGLPNKTSPQLVLDAVRCALSTGDYDTAEKYLNSAVRNSKDENIQATIKLYEVWCSLCKVSDSKSLEEPVAILKTYSTLSSMECVRPQLLLTVWYLTGDLQYAEKIKSQFPTSPEAAVVQGKAQMLPTPFWFFVPRKGNAIVEASEADAASVTSKKASASAATAATPAKSETPASDDGSKIVKQQLGLFKNQSNAQSLVSTLKEKGFEAYIIEETRASGTKYYIVVVDEDKDSSVGAKLRSAGFECYMY